MLLLRVSYRGLAVAALAGALGFAADTSVKDLAARLLELPGPAEQQELLSRSSNLVSSELAFAVLDHAHEDRIHGNLKQSLAAAQLALAIAERANAGAAQARALLEIGLVYQDEGYIQEQIEWFQKSLKASEAIHDDRAAALALNNIGKFYKDEGEFDRARDFYVKSLEIGEKLYDNPTIIRAVGNLGVLSGEPGDYVQALSFTKRAEELTEKSGDPRAQGVVALNIGTIYEQQGDYVQAAAYSQRALDLVERVGDRVRTAIALSNLGNDNQLRGDLATAIEQYHKSLAISEAIGDKQHAAVNLAHLGNVHLARKEYAAAIDFYKESLHIQEEIGNREDAAETIVQLAAAYNLQGNYEQALQFASRAQEIAGYEGFIQPGWRSRLQAGKAYRGLNRQERAEAEFSRAISVIEDVRQHVVGDESEQAGFFNERLEVYSRMIELQAASGRKSEALEYSERAKARVLVDVLKTGRSELDGVLTAEEHSHDQQLRSQLAALNVQVMRESRGRAKDARPSPLQSKLEDVRLQYSAFRTSLYVSHPEMRIQRGELQPVRAEEAQRLLGPETTLLEYAVSDDKLVLFVCGSRGELQVFVQPIEEQKLADTVEQFRRQLANRDLAFRPTAQRLYQLVLAPASSHLKGSGKLVIVPDGVLWELPFQALLDPTGRYLLDDYAISYAPSLTAWKSMNEVKKGRRQNRGQSQLLAMGNPQWESRAADRLKAVYRDQDFGALPLAESEVRQLAKIYGENQSHVYIGREARESRFKAEAADSSVLHLATHGILNNASPLYSYLLLAGEGNASEEDGILEARELLQMKLHADLAVLSACETARGRVGVGEGMIGLSWALFVAGVPTTVLSQWKVESDSTSRMMVAFHQNRQKRMSDAEALRAAALSIRKDPAWQHPFYWAPFIAIGAALQ